MLVPDRRRLLWSGMGRSRATGILGSLVLVCSLVFSAAQSSATTYYVATDGNDLSGDGGAANPWRTIAHAVNSGIPADGGHTVLVRSGLYDGPNILTRGFPAEVVIRADEDHGAVPSQWVP